MKFDSRKGGHPSAGTGKESQYTTNDYNPANMFLVEFTNHILMRSSTLAFLTGLVLVGGIIGYGSYLYLPSGEEQIFLSTTTSVQNTGLLDYLVEEFEASNPRYQVIYTAIGSGAAIQLARDGEVDAILVHAPQMEQELVADSYADRRHTLWYNYFLLVGPVSDPASISSATNVTQVMERIYHSGEKGNITFYSRGDRSGTHLKELAVWNMTQYQPQVSQNPWYRETGTGMAATLDAAANDDHGYALTDLGTFATLKNSQSSLQLTKLFEQDQLFYNPYSYLITNADTTGTDLNTQGAQVFLQFLEAPSTDELVLQYRVGDTVLFYPIDRGQE